MIRDYFKRCCMNNYFISKIYTFLFISLTFYNGCTTYKNNAPAEKKNMSEKIYVESVDSRVVLSKLDELEVKIKGNLPSPAYTFDRFDVKVSKNVIEITPMAKHDPYKIVTQVLVPFEEVCKVRNLKPGNYEIKVMGRGDSVISKKNIVVSE